MTLADQQGKPVARLHIKHDFWMRPRAPQKSGLSRNTAAVALAGSAAGRYTRDEFGPLDRRVCLMMLTIHGPCRESGIELLSLAEKPLPMSAGRPGSSADGRGAGDVIGRDIRDT